MSDLTIYLTTESDQTSVLLGTFVQTSSIQVAQDAAASAANAVAASNSASIALSAQVTVAANANSASTSATNAASSATAAASSASTATAASTNATGSATAASNSATSASTSATSATGSATAAANSATAASGSATSASTSAGTATTQATNASNSASAASTSATNASNSSAAAANFASNASTSAGTASTQATNAGNSASAASTSETNAANSATAAGTSATNAGNSATAAANSASAAAASAASIALPIPVSSGGSGATSAANARTNLAVPGLATTNTFTQNQTLSVASGTVNLILDAPSNSGTSGILLESNGVPRWRLSRTNATESGSNAGSALTLGAYNDAGVSLGSAWLIDRPTLTTTFYTRPNFNGYTPWDSQNLDFTKPPAIGATTPAAGTFTTVKGTGEVQASAQARVLSPSYGVIIRNDDSNAYLLSTASGSPTGGFNGLRPFYWNLATGAVNIDGTGAGVTLSGALKLSSASQSTLYIGQATYSTAQALGNSAWPGWTFNAQGAAFGQVNGDTSFYMSKAPGYSAGGYFAFCYNGGAIGGIGIASASSVAFNTTSDYRLKNIRAEIDDDEVLSSIESGKYYRGAYKTEPDNEIDFIIAHEFAEIVPEAVTGDKDAVEYVPIYRDGFTPSESNPDVSPDDVTGLEERIIPQQVDHSKAVVRAMAGIKALKRKNDVRDAEISTLQSNITALEARIAALEAASGG